jgi:hypothetical protein
MKTQCSLDIDTMAHDLRLDGALVAALQNCGDRVAMSRQRPVAGVAEP